jgi:hypothetical protein
MRSRHALVLLSLAAGCGSSGTGSTHDDTAQLKRDAAEQLMRHPEGPDLCQTHGWYGDGECDEFCPEDDLDCGIACATSTSASDGQCDARDPCAPFNDPDCQDQVDCSEPPSASDGRCDRDDPCAAFRDPDCVVSCPGITLPADLLCSATRACAGKDPDCAAHPPRCPEGQHPANQRCTAPPGCEQLDVDCAEGPVACIEIAYDTNGKCEAAPGCEYTDPEDCAPVCAAVTPVRDGMCLGDPCDEDC